MPNQAPLWLIEVITRCQELAGHVPNGPGPELGRRVRALRLEPPTKVPLEHQLIGRVLIGQALARTARQAGIYERSDVQAAFLDLTGAAVGGRDWVEDVQKLITCCADALELWDEHTNNDSVISPRILRAVRTLNKCYADAGLTLGRLAADSGLSASYFSRMLKRQTGCGFGELLHRARIAAALRLLQETSLTIKEIADEVGYDSSTQFGRHFRSHVGITAVAFRRQTTAK